jgi:prepilin-type N-terminal cleavage/methylation domain-containing protein
MNKTHNSGFTLLEVIIVVLVMALVLAVTYPSFSRGSTSLHLRSSSRDILNAFRCARDKAVTEQTGMIVIVDKGKQMLILSDNLGGRVRTYSMPKDVQISRVALAGNEVTNGPMIVRFLTNGSTDDAEVLLTADTGKQLKVVTDPLTGGGRIESSQGESIR